MSKRWLSVMTAILMTVGLMGLTSMEAKADMPTDVKLTSEQQEEMKALQQEALKPVSYTHLTLPTKRIV